MKLDAAVAAREQFERFFSQRDDHGKSDDLEYAILKQVYESLDLDRYESIRSTLLDSKDIGSEAKYLDLLYWLRSKLRIALEQEMHRRPSQRVLDLGSGPGHFPFLCRRLGHRRKLVSGSRDDPSGDLRDIAGKRLCQGSHLGGCEKGWDQRGHL